MRLWKLEVCVLYPIIVHKCLLFFIFTIHINLCWNCVICLGFPFGSAIPRNTVNAKAGQGVKRTANSSYIVGNCCSIITSRLWKPQHRTVRIFLARPHFVELFTWKQNKALNLVLVTQRQSRRLLASKASWDEPVVAEKMSDVCVTQGNLLA